MGLTLSARCGAQFPVGFFLTVSVSGFPPSTAVGIDLLDLNQVRLIVLASGLVTDATGSLNQGVTINQQDGVYVVRVFCDDGTGTPVDGEPEEFVRVAVPCDVLYALMSNADPNATPVTVALEIVDITSNPPLRLRTIEVGNRGTTALAVAPDRRRFYVTDNTAKIVAAFDATTAAPDPNSPALPLASATLPNARLLALSADGRTLYATSGTNVAAINTATMTVLPQTFNTPDNKTTFGIELSPDGQTLAVTATDGQTASVVHLLDAKTLAVKRSITLTVPPSFPNAGVLTQPAFTDATVDRLLLWDVCFSIVYQIDLTPLTQTPPDFAAVAQVTTGTVLLLLTAPTNSSLIASTQPMFYSPVSQNAYVLGLPETINDQILLDEVNPLAAAVFGQTGGFVGGPYAICLKPDGKTLYVTVRHPGPPSQADTLDVFDTSTHVFTQRSVYTFSNPALNVQSMVILSFPRA